jgi:hypothetical protein
MTYDFNKVNQKDGYMMMNKTYTFDENLVSDIHKDAYGFRPRDGFWSRWSNATIDQKQVIWDELLDEAQEWHDFDPDC